jgi:hypothetical protein
MKSIIITILLALGVASVFTACERNDYQHPMHRK